MLKSSATFIKKEFLLHPFTSCERDPGYKFFKRKSTRMFPEWSFWFGYNNCPFLVQRSFSCFLFDWHERRDVTGGSEPPSPYENQLQTNQNPWSQQCSGSSESPINALLNAEELRDYSRLRWRYFCCSRMAKINPLYISYQKCALSPFCRTHKMFQYLYRRCERTIRVYPL